MASPYRVAIIGTGRPWNAEGRTGSGMAHMHMLGYNSRKDCEVVALADIKPENAEAFAAHYGLPAAIYADYKKMLRKEQPDIVSICTPTISATHAGHPLRTQKNPGTADPALPPK